MTRQANLAESGKDTMESAIQQASAEQASAVAALAVKLWPDHSQAEMADEFSHLLTSDEAAVFLCLDQGTSVGFAQCQLRHDYVEGTESSPVGYLEGIYVAEAYRCRGIARRLLDACQCWAAAQGCAEFASDCELTNVDSQRFHEAVGFREANRIVAYVRKLNNACEIKPSGV